MTVGNIKGATPAYQGSGLETSAAQKATSEPKVTASQNHAGAKERRHDSEMAALEVNESPRSESVKRAVEEINKKAKNSEAVFGVHEETNRVTIKIVDKETKEIIREFPPEETLDMIAKVWELAGLMVDEKR